MKTAVVAVGGNALVADNDHMSIDHQREAASGLARDLLGVVGDWRLVVTHGNGPQVGFILRRSELLATAPDIPAIGLGMAVADSQGGIGHLLASALASALTRAGDDHEVAAVVTHTVVDPADPSFTQPAKPIGPWVTAPEADRLRDQLGWVLADEPGRGWRRLVASPAPVRILESRAVAALLDAGFVVVAAGGGGIPVVADAAAGYRPVDAVVDKDHSSGLLAASLGADLLVLTTGVDQVSLDFGLPTQRPLAVMTATEAERHLAAGQFPAGSMGPKIAASVAFLRAGGAEVVVTSLARLADALEGGAGTRIVGDGG